MLLASDILAQSGGSYEVTAFSIDGGVGEDFCGDFKLIGIMGQPDAGTLTGGRYILEGGFELSRPRSSCIVHLPVILKETN